MLQQTNRALDLLHPGLMQLFPRHQRAPWSDVSLTHTRAHARTHTRTCTNTNKAVEITLLIFALNLNNTTPLLFAARFLDTV